MRMSLAFYSCDVKIVYLTTNATHELHEALAQSLDKASVVGLGVYFLKLFDLTHLGKVYH
jgi:hypothetical protein